MRRLLFAILLSTGLFFLFFASNQNVSFASCANPGQSCGDYSSPPGLQCCNPTQEACKPISSRIPDTVCQAITCANEGQSCGGASDTQCCLSTDFCSTTQVGTQVCEPIAGACVQEGSQCSASQPCCNASDICTGGSGISLSTCQRNPALCQYTNSTCNPSAATPCCYSTDSCVSSGLGGYTCQRKSTVCAPEGEACNPQASQPCCDSTDDQCVGTAISPYTCQRKASACGYNNSYCDPQAKQPCCTAGYTCTTTALGIPTCLIATTPTPGYPLSACPNGVCQTALGPISTNALSFIQKLFAVVLSLAGGIAVLLIIISGYRLMASQGNPEAVQKGKEQLTAAIIGLLFVIFSYLVLQVIGVNILGIFK